MNSFLSRTALLTLALISAKAPLRLAAQTSGTVVPNFTYKVLQDPASQIWQVLIVNPGANTLKCMIAYSTVDNLPHPQSGTWLVFVPSPTKIPGSPASGFPSYTPFNGFVNLSATVDCVNA